MKTLLRILALTLWTLFLCMTVRGQAANVYITPTGSATGICTTGTQAPSWFNSSANWGTGAGQIGPGTVVHLCGIFTAAAGANGFLQFQDSGTSGHPITLQWESGAIVQAPVFGVANGGIDVNGQSYLLLTSNGGGTIQNTANGTGMTYHQSSYLIYNDGNNNTITNLTIGPCYVHTSGDPGGNACQGVYNYLANNATIGPGNAFSQYDVGIYQPFEGSQSNLVITGNSFALGNQAIEMGPGNGGTNTFTNIRVDHNTYATSGNWYDTNDDYHHNFFHPFTNTANSSILGTLLVYDNTMAGTVSNSTSFIYLENNNGGTGGTMGTWYIFNNTFNKTDTPAASTGLFVSYAGGCYLLNNTFLDAGNASNPWPTINITAPGCTVENNVLSGSGYFVYNVAKGAYTSDKNIYYNASYNDPWQWGSCGGPCQYGTIGGWRTACSCDASAITSNPLLNPNLSIQAGSPAATLGNNLTGLGITALNSDIAGNARPASGPWPAGAFNASSGTPTAVISITPSSVPFGNQTQNTTSAAMTVTVNSTGTGPLTLGASFLSFTGANGGDFTRSGGTCSNNLPVASGSSCTVLVVFRPVTLVSVTGQLNISSNATSGTGFIPLTGTGVAPLTYCLTAAPTTWTFPSVPVGSTTATRQFIVTNACTGSVTLANPVTTFGGSYIADWSLATGAGDTCASGLVLVPAPGTPNTCTKTIQGKPSIVGTEPGTVTFSSTTTGAAATSAISMTGTSITPTMAISPTGTIQFGNVTQGVPSSIQTVTVTNTSTVSFPLNTPYDVFSNPDFSDPGTGTCHNGTVLAASGTCLINMIFTPSGTTAETGTLTVNGVGLSPTANAALAGTGIAAAPVPAPLPWVFSMTCSRYAPGDTRCTMSLPATRVLLPGLTKGPQVFTIPGGLTITVVIE